MREIKDKVRNVMISLIILILIIFSLASCSTANYSRTSYRDNGMSTLEYNVYKQAQRNQRSNMFPYKHKH